MPWLRGTTEAIPRDGRELAPIRIFTDLIELNGFVAPAGQRITDILLRGQDVAFLPMGAVATPENWILISSMEILLVAPPPLGARTAWHERRDLRVVSLCVGRYRVRGTAHLAPGIDPSMFNAQRGFLPLTDARVGEERFRVVIVNLGRAIVDQPVG